MGDIGVGADDPIEAVAARHQPSDRDELIEARSSQTSHDASHRVSDDSGWALILGRFWGVTHSQSLRTTLLAPVTAAVGFAWALWWALSFTSHYVSGAAWIPSVAPTLVK